MRNTCCQLWTIDIDEPTAERYHSMTGSLGKAFTPNPSLLMMKAVILSFLKHKPMCPYSNEKGLCKSSS